MSSELLEVSPLGCLCLLPQLWTEAGPIAAVSHPSRPASNFHFWSSRQTLLKECICQVFLPHIKNKTKQKHKGTGESLGGIGRSLALTVGLVSGVCVHPNSSEGKCQMLAECCRFPSAQGHRDENGKTTAPSRDHGASQLTELSQEITAPRPYLRPEWTLVPHPPHRDPSSMRETVS